MELDFEEIEVHFDDLQEARRLVSEYTKKKGELDDDIKDFSSVVNKTLRTFRRAVNHLDDENVEKCLEEYKKAFDGHDVANKFVMYWRNMLKTKSPTTDIKLPSGKELTIVVLGKTGNGKSATANRILGAEQFKSSPDATSVTTNCAHETRKLERRISVIDTPGVLDTSRVTVLLSKWFDSKARIIEEKILTEVSRMFAMAPKGFDAILLVVEYGTRFSDEDSKALTLLTDFLGSESKAYMILLFTHGDEAKRQAKRTEQSPKECLDHWITTLPPWVVAFIEEIGHRVVLFDNTLIEDEDPEGCKKELSQLIETIDKMNSGKGPFVHFLTEASKEVLDEHIKKALNSIGLDIKLEKMTKEKEDLEKLLMKKDLSQNEKNQAEDLLKKLKEEIVAEKENVREVEAKEREKQAREASKAKFGGKATQSVMSRLGCFPGSSTFVDEWGSRRRMHSLQIGEKVQVVSNGSICLQPVISFIHREQEKLQEFLSITTTNNSNLKITEDHLLFVEKNGLPQAIPARGVKIGDSVYVKQNELIGTGTVKEISIVYEKGVYAPVTSSGTILVDDVHTSCYFDVLSHEWSHRAMGVVRAMYHVSPWMLQWISSVGEKDGFPGWCRLAHKMLTFMD